MTKIDSEEKNKYLLLHIEQLIKASSDPEQQMKLFKENQDGTIGLISPRIGFRVNRPSIYFCLMPDDIEELINLSISPDFPWELRAEVNILDMVRDVVNEPASLYSDRDCKEGVLELAEALRASATLIESAVHGGTDHV